jgi:hypothetical protein
MPKITTQATKRQSLTMLDKKFADMEQPPKPKWQVDVDEHFRDYPKTKELFLAMDLEEFMEALTKYAKIKQEALKQWYSEQKKVPHKHFMVKNNNNLLK